MSKQQMKAIGLLEYLPVDQPESLLDVLIDKPEPTGKDLLIRVKAISVNPVDVKVRAPKNKTENTPKILGWDVAGIVEQAGPEASLFKPGDEVYYAGSIARPGGNSEFHLVDEQIVGFKPATLEFTHAAALPLTAITAWEGLFDRLGVSPHTEHNEDKTILIIGAAGGVGSITTQLAKHAGLTVIGTASRPESAEWATNMGADHIINHYEAFLPQLESLGLATVDYIFCLNSTDTHWVNMAETIAPQGKICSIVETDEPLDLTLLKNKSVTFVWELMFTRPLFQTPDLIEQHKLLNEVSRMIDKGSLRTTVAQILSPINAANLRKAHGLLEEGRMTGKIVLENFE